METVIGYGSTEPGATGWVKYGDKDGFGIFVDVDTSNAGFMVTPMYFTSIEGTGGHWDAQGVSAIYDASPTGFRVHIKRTDRKATKEFTPAAANSRRWHIRWFGIQGG